MARNRSKLDPEERRENALRPSRYLGFNRDALGVYLMSRGAFELAESQFRRAVWLNPFEPMFKVHWAMALMHLDRQAEAKVLIDQVLEADPNHSAARQLRQRHWPERPVDQH